MSESTRQGKTLNRITPPMREMMYAYGGDALKRLESYGMDDRRESAYALILASTAPLIGMLVLGWEPAGVIVVLLINLLIGLTDDIIKVIRSRSTLSETLHACAQDEYVWQVARALARGRTTVYAKTLSTPEQIERGETQSLLWFAALLAYLIAGFCLLLLYGPGARSGSGNMVFLGTVPSLLMALLFSAFHAMNHHPHWRMAGSTRMQTSAHTGFFIAAIATIPFLVLASPSVTTMSDRKLADFLCFATLAYGIYRVWTLSALKYTAQWLRYSTQRMEKGEADSRGVQLR